MKVFAISDLHLSINCEKPMNIFGPVWNDHFEKIKRDWLSKVTDEDLVLISGDISWAMTLEESIADLDIISELPGKKIIIRGNHDYWWKSISAVRSILKENMFALQNDSIKFDNFVICGTRGWTVPEESFVDEHDEKIYNRELLRLELSLKNAKSKFSDGDTLICMIHYPPFNSRYESNEFTKLLDEYGVKYVIYGHLHGRGGRSSLVVEKNKITYLLTSCDKTDNKLIEII